MINENITNSENFISFDNAIKLMKYEVDRALFTSPSIVNTYTKHLTQASGKFIRAISLITCAQGKDGLVHINAVKFAAAIEILHLATLVHDDVIDNAHKRRGILTLQKKFGKRTAVICGDYLFCVAIKLASSIPNKNDYLEFNIPDYMSKVCLGELNQHINNGNLDLSVYKYLKIIAGKTAALFEASFYAGAILCDSEKSDVNKYMKLGRYIGMIFQLTDDCIDFETSEQIAKKPVQSDYEQGVITLPLIYAFMNMGDFKEKAKSNKISREDINNAVLKTGGLNYTKAVSKRYYDKAINIIKDLNAEDEKKRKLTEILEKAFKGL